MSEIDILRGTRHSIDSVKLQRCLEGSKYHVAGDYKIPGESTILYRIQKRNNEDPFTVVEVAAPENSNGHNAEATIALMRPVDSESGGPEFLDLYNNGYEDSRQMGIRVQSRGSGQLRDFVFDFNSGASGVMEVLRIRHNGIKSQRNIAIVKDGAALELYTAEGALAGTLKRVGARLVIDNPISGASLDFYDGGYNRMYFPAGAYIYTDGGPLYLNDVDLRLLAYPVNAIYLSSVNTDPGDLLGGTWATVTPPAGMYAWRRTA